MIGVQYASTTHLHGKWRRRQKEYLHWISQLRKGTVVAALYDGKGGRACPGRVVMVRRGRVRVRFARYGKAAQEKDMTVVTFNRDGGGWDQYPDALMPRLFGARRTPGDWYRLAPLSVSPKYRELRAFGAGI